MGIPLYEPFLEEEDFHELEEVVRSGWISPRGKSVKVFEEDIIDFIGVEHGMAVDSGTAAIHLALEALEIGEGDEVLVPDFTFGSVGSVVRAVGADPIPVDIEEDTLGIDPGKAEEAVNEKTRAVVVAHMFGHPADMNGITRLAEQNDLHVIEDSAQAFGSKFDGDRTGSIGDIGCFSFSWNKTLTTGKGGFVVTDSGELLERMERAADYGRANDSKREFVEPGFNYRMDSVRASLGRSQFSHIKEVFERKTEIVEMYQERLGGAGLQIPEFSDGLREGIPWMFYVMLDEREEVLAALRQKGIGCREFYRPLHRMAMFEDRFDYPVSESVSSRGIALPTPPTLTRRDVSTVCETIRGVVQDR